jgi:peptidoglycan/LPS O-acetylase OafA/YrhL
MVLLSHVSFHNLSGGQLGFMASAGKQAVDVFFVLSGFVIAHVCAEREHDALNYVVNRAARIYSVAIPALVLTAIVDSIGMSVSPGVYEGAVQEMSPGLLVRSVLFIGEQWNAHRFPGCNGPYWFLGFEVWYYAAFGVYTFAPRRWRWLATLAVLVFIGPKVTLMFPNWLLGVLAYRACISISCPRPLGWALMIVPLGILGLYQIVPHSPVEQFAAASLDIERLRRTVEDYFISTLVAAHLIGFCVVSSSFGASLERHARGIRWVAGATFSLYLTHLPVMHLLAAISPWPAGSGWTALLLVTGTPFVCLAFAEVSERRKAMWRGVIAGLMGSLRVRATASASNGEVVFAEVGERLD